MTTPNYRYAVNWIAQMDEAGNAEALDERHVSELVTVQLIADTWGKDPMLVARDVIAARNGSDLRTIARAPCAA